VRARTAAVLAAALWLAACTGVPSGLEPVRFDAARFLGTWYEIARLDHRFERGLTDVTATYGAREDGVSVFNRGWSPSRCAWQEIEGTARFLRGSDVASLGVTFAWPIEGGYHVIALGEAYDWAVVSGPTRDYLWLLARTPAVPAETLARMEAAARAAGFDTGALIRVAHGAPACDG
jgi:apolipoprotein D and lipocalin family protein